MNLLVSDFDGTFYDENYENNDEPDTNCNKFIFINI